MHSMCWFCTHTNRAF